MALSTEQVRVLVCGGRHFSRENYLRRSLGQLGRELGWVRGGVILIQGEAPGADLMAKKWAHDVGIPTMDFPADWKSFGRRAGSIRNTKMIVEGQPTLVVAFQGGTGTQNMISQSTKKRIKIITVGWGPPETRWDSPSGT